MNKFSIFNKSHNLFLINNYTIKNRLIKALYKLMKIRVMNARKMVGEKFWLII